MVDELVKYDAMGLSDLIRKGEITPAELLEITIHRIEKINPKINAVIYKMYDQAHVAAEIWSSGTKTTKISDSMFCGIPFLFVRGDLKLYFIRRFENVVLIVCIFFPKLYFLL
jgi:Asp-tRNA(Asn)/Glu-tRNA(Gln) amidotransferase A subunit family amidase